MNDLALCALCILIHSATTLATCLEVQLCHEGCSGVHTIFSFHLFPVKWRGKRNVNLLLLSPNEASTIVRCLCPTTRILSFRPGMNFSYYWYTLQWLQLFSRTWFIGKSKHQQRRCCRTAFAISFNCSFKPPCVLMPWRFKTTSAATYFYWQYARDLSICHSFCNTTPPRTKISSLFIILLAVSNSVISNLELLPL